MEKEMLPVVPRCAATTISSHPIASSRAKAGWWDVTLQWKPHLNYARAADQSPTTYNTWPNSVAAWGNTCLCVKARFLHMQLKLLKATLMLKSINKDGRVNEKEHERRYCRNTTEKLFKIKQKYSRIIENKAERNAPSLKDLLQIWNYIYYCVTFPTLIKCIL